MIKIVTAFEMKMLDQRATSELKIPSLLLMENAARGIVDYIERKIGGVKGLRVVLLCGSGNNGGDGLAVARHLQTRTAQPHLYLLAPAEKLSGDAKIMLDAWIAREGTLQIIGSFSSEEMIDTLSKSDLIIDAILGTGLSHPVQGEYKNAIDCINTVRQRCNIPIVSIDIPSGISADTGEIMGVAVKADYTATIAFPKRGMFLQDGLEHRGEWDVIDIGFSEKLSLHIDMKVSLIGNDIKTIASLPRNLGAHKGTFGHLLLIAGSRGKQGAAAMAGLSAMRSGTGLVTIALPQSIDHAILPHLMEAMTLPVSETLEGTLSRESESTLLKAMEGKKAVAIGPGLSQNPETVQLVLNLISQIRLPMVIDADGINALATDISVLRHRHPDTDGAIILTPHPGEMGRLLGISAEKVQKDRINIASGFAREWGVIVVLKGAHTVIADMDGEVFLANVGNPGMASAGTGDVLTGIIGGALALGMNPKEAAQWGVILHGTAGDFATDAMGERSCMAHDLIENIPRAISVFSSATDRSRCFIRGWRPPHSRSRTRRDHTAARGGGR